MYGEAKLLVKFLEGSDTRFIIPVYQRNYDWKQDNCKQLYDDLVKVITQERERHFFGSIVFVNNVKGSAFDFLIIDGQQRVTTISLLMLAMVNLLKEGKITAEDQVLQRKIEESYLVDKYQPEEKKVKLKPIKDDQDAFLRLFKDQDEYKHSSNVTQNYMYFYKRIQNGEISVDDLYKAISSLEIIAISLDPTKDDAQLIFESLNSTGLDLSEGDKIRNFILMGLDSELQEKYYYDYWNKIEKQTGYNVSDFIRHYLTIKNGKTPTLRSIYTSFKKFVEEGKFEIEALLEDLVTYSKYYCQIITSTTTVETANRVLKRLNLLDMSVSIPYLLGLMDYKNDKLTDDEFTEILLTIETYIFRRLICNVPTNSLNKTFALLHKECLKYIDNDETANYCEVVKYALLNKPSYMRMPLDAEFLLCMEDKDFYSLQSKNKYYLFDRLENQDSYEYTNVVEFMKNGNYSVEHIMPQTLSSTWKVELGENYQSIYDRWINKIANLTLTGYNSEYSNNSFDDKKNRKDGFVDSPLRLNQFVAKCTKWTEEELVARNEWFKNLFLKLWPLPTTKFEPVIKENFTHNIEDDFDFTGEQIISYTFMDTRYPADSWVEMYKRVVGMLYDLDATILYKLIGSDDGLGTHFINHEENSYTQIGDNLFMLTSLSTWRKISVLRRLFDLYGLDYNDLIIEIKSKEA